MKNNKTCEANKYAGEHKFFFFICLFFLISGEWNPFFLFFFIFFEDYTGKGSPCYLLYFFFKKNTLFLASLPSLHFLLYPVLEKRKTRING